MDRKHPAKVVVYHLEGHSSGFQDKIDTALGDEIQDKADKMEKLIKYLGRIYPEDGLQHGQIIRSLGDCSKERITRFRIYR